MATDGGCDGTDVTPSKPSSVSQDSDSASTESSDTENPSDDNRSSRPRKNEMRRLVSVIYGQIQSLYKASLLLRRPDMHDTYLPSAPGSQIGPYIAHFDKDDILGKMREWALDRGHRYEEPIDAQSLVSRLAIANTMRREQLRFWQNRPNRPPGIGAQPTVSAEGQLASSSRFHGAGFAQIQPPQTGSELSAPTISDGTKQGFSVATKSVPGGSETFSESPRTAYKPSPQERGWYSRLPDVPRPQPGRLTFDCPLCFSELDVGSMQQRKTWK